MSNLVGTFIVDGARQPGVRIANEGEDLRKIGKLRYSLYVARDKKAYPAADHHDQCLIEPVDFESLNLLGLVDGSCVATVRITKARLALKDEYLHRLLLNSPFDASTYGKLAVASRLAADPNAESRALLLSVLRDAYKIVLQSGIAFTLAATRTSLLPFFVRLGFVPSGQSYAETISGTMNVLVLDMYNRKHLESVGSIFLDDLNAFENEEIVGGSA